ncbi:MAG: glycosyltransferase family 2 protein [Candidatus Marinimicrobia bacterium]|nr:glycosyltransferase family 2 protein [Candidatus Neomarinimicrobiota bacterium]MBL7109958.1 glycosyltransferase family 2 protein [Candidatus Neomarinimicrobiota bacterium]
MKNNSNRPFVSVVIPVYNEEKYIGNTLNSIFLQDYPTSAFEVLVVDGNSNDRTREIISKFVNTHKNIKLIHNVEKIIPIGLNLGIQFSKGDIIIRMDGHCEIQSDYISNCVKSLNAKDIDCVGGVITTKSNGNLISKSIAYAQSSFFGVGNVPFRTGSKESKLVDSVAWGAYRRKVFSKIGGYDEELVCNEDDEFNFRLTESGGKILLNPKIKSTYYSRCKYFDLWKQYWRYGYFKIRVFQKIEKMLSLRHFIPSLFVVSLFFPIILVLALPLRGLQYVIPLIYAIVNLLSSIIVARKNKKMIPFIMISYSILHLSYGVGFIFGLWKFRKKWAKSRTINEYFNKHKFKLNSNKQI